MAGTRWGWSAALVLLVGLAVPGSGRAGWLFGHHKCPPPSYSPHHQWTPALYRFARHVHGPTLSVHPPDRYPGLPVTYQIFRYPCPPVDPAQLVAERAIAP